MLDFLLDKIAFDIVSQDFSACLSLQIEFNMIKPHPSFTFLGKPNIRFIRTLISLFHTYTSMIFTIWKDDFVNNLYLNETW